MFWQNLILLSLHSSINSSKYNQFRESRLEVRFQTSSLEIQKHGCVATGQESHPKVWTSLKRIFCNAFNPRASRKRIQIIINPTNFNLSSKFDPIGPHKVIPKIQIKFFSLMCYLNRLLVHNNNPLELQIFEFNSKIHTISETNCQNRLFLSNV